MKSILTVATTAVVSIISSSSYIIPSSSSSSSPFHPPSLALFLWFNNNRSSHKKIGRRRHHHERRVPFSLTLSAAIPPSSPSYSEPGGGKGKLYNDNELLEVLLLHQSITTNSTNDEFDGNNPRVVFDATDDDLNISKKEEEPTATAPLGGIHDWILQSLENDIGNVIVDDDTEEEGSSLMSTTVHDWILHAIENDSPAITSFDVIDAHDNDDETATANDDNDHLRMLLQNRKPYIRAIATDVDGTLLKGTYMHPITRDAIVNSISQAYNNDGRDNGESKRHFFVATGKSRAGAMTSLGPIIGSLISNIPGVYCQGLYCIDDQGNIIFECKLQHSAIEATEALAAELNVSIVAYDGDNLYTTNCTDSVISLSELYGEPQVKLLFDEQTSSPINLADYQPGMHKLLLLDDDLVKLAHVRTRLEILAHKHSATVTQAIPTMLELLPAGCSKAYGVGQVCLALGIDPKTELLAIGDAENDVGMLKMASIGVAVGNACPQARNAAVYVMKERVDEGGAGLAMDLFGFDLNSERG